MKHHIYNTNSSLYIFIRFTTMLRFMITSSYWQWITCIVLFGLCVSVQSIDAEVEIGTESSAIRSGQTKKELTQVLAKTLPPTIENTFSYADIFKIELHLDMPGNIKIMAIDSNVEVKDTISVKLEKRVLAENPIFKKEYLEKITLTMTQKDGVLQLNVQLPNQANDEKSMSELKKDLQLNYEIKTPPDVSIELKVRDGDVYIHHLRGKIDITNELGNVHLDETSGNYRVETYSGRIHGQILLTSGQNEIKTEKGSIDLSGT